MNDTVHKWYENKKNVEEMLRWNKGKLKKWEQKVVEYFPDGAKILDIGCGTGREAFALADMGFSVAGIDISEEVIRQAARLASQNHYDIPFLLYDGHILPFENETFDVVIIWAQTFGLLYGDTYKISFLKECFRILKNDGLISFSGHDSEYLSEHYNRCTIGRKFYPYSDDEIYWETFLMTELAAFAENAGFSVILCEQGEIYKPEDGVVLHCLGKK